jgi:hypothetical protein
MAEMRDSRLTKEFIDQFLSVDLDGLSAEDIDRESRAAYTRAVAALKKMDSEPKKPDFDWQAADDEEGREEAEYEAESLEKEKLAHNFTASKPVLVKKDMTAWNQTMASARAIDNAINNQIMNDSVRAQLTASIKAMSELRAQFNAAFDGKATLSAADALAAFKAAVQPAKKRVVIVRRH